MGKLRLSISARNTKIECDTKYYFSKKMYLPRPPGTSTTLGTVLHAVLERYFDADLMGLDEKGNPKILYPEGWRVAKQFDGSQSRISPDEADKVKAFVQRAESEGKLIRRVGGHAEWGFEENILPDIDAIGEIDYCYEFTIEDHKTCKNYRFTKTDDPKCPKWLGKDPQVLLYLYFWCRHYSKESGEPIPEYVRAIHRQFNKTTGEIRLVPAKIPWTDVLSFYEVFKKDALEIKELRDKESHLDVSKNRDSCGNFGGCEYKGICNKRESIDMYKRRINVILENNKTTKEKKLGLKSLKNKAAKGTVAPPKQEKILDELDKADAGSSKAISLADQLKDVNKLIVDLINSLTPAGLDEDAILATPKGKELVSIRESVMECISKKDAADKEEAKKKEEAEKAKEVEKPKTEAKKEAPKETPKESTADETIEFEKPSKQRTTDPILCVGCVPFGGLVSTISIAQVLDTIVLEYAKEGVAFYELNAFTRRDTLASGIDKVIEGLKGFVIIAGTNKDGDQDKLVDLLIGKGVRTFKGTV